MGEAVAGKIYFVAIIGDGMTAPVPRRMVRNFLLLIIIALGGSCVSALEWRTSWAKSAQGPYPTGFGLAQPELALAIPDGAAGAVDQTFRMLVLPTIWGPQARVRFTNVFGNKEVTVDGAFLALHQNAGAVVDGTSQPILFSGKPSVTIPPGIMIWSDPVRIPYYEKLGYENLLGRRLAVSFHVAGQSGPLTWHALAGTLSYISPPRSGSLGDRVSGASFPFSTSSTFLIDAVDMMAPADTRVVVCLGDSITDGMLTPVNSDGSWPSVLARRFWEKAGNTVAVINAGINANMVYGPPAYKYNAKKPIGGGPSAFERVDRDVLLLSGVSAMIWLEGINDLHAGTANAETLGIGMKAMRDHVKERNPGILYLGGTLISSLGSTMAGYGTAGVNTQRQRLNDFIRTSGAFDAVIDFDAALNDPATGKMQKQFLPENLFGSPGDGLHPNLAGHLRMGEAVPLDILMGKGKP